MKYEIGDTAIVRKDLEIGKTYGGCDFIGRMDEFRGQQVTIVNNLGDNGYEIEEDGIWFTWTSEMFEDVTPLHSENEISQPIIKDFTYFKNYQSFEEVNLSTGETKTDSFIIPGKKQRVIYNKNATIVILNYGTSHQVKGVAKCMPGDKFDELKGLKIAYHKAKIKELEKALKKLINS